MTPALDPADLVGYPPDVAARYVREGAWPQTTVGARLHEACLERPATVAVVTPGDRLTFGELDELSDRFGAALLGRGLEQGERVVFQVGNTVEGVVAYYGTVKAGLVPVCAIPQHGERDILMLAERARPRAHVVQTDFRSQDLVALATNVAARPGGPELVVGLGAGSWSGPTLEALVDEVAPAAARSAMAAVTLAPSDVAVLQLSGGTTGTPKLIPRLHCEYVYNATRWAAVAGWDASSVVLHAIPLLHNAGLSAALQPAHFCGATFATLPRPTADDVLDLIEREGVTAMPVTPPALLRDLLDAQLLRPRDLSSLRRLIVAGQRLDGRLATRLEDELGLPCLQKFGMAEGMFLATPPEAPEWVRRGTVGAPISPLDEVRILAAGGEDEVAVGELGELCCRGPYTVRGYYAAPERNREAFTADGFYLTGDLARAHEHAGRLVYSVEGRIKDTINRGAEKISAEDVENVLVMHPQVRAAAVVAMPDERLGERACAYLVPVAGDLPTLEELVAFCLDQGMARFKLPERLERLDALPLTNIGKVAKNRLREDVARRLAAEDGARA